MAPSHTGNSSYRITIVVSIKDSYLFVMGTDPRSSCIIGKHCTSFYGFYYSIVEPMISDTGLP